MPSSINAKLKSAMRKITPHLLFSITSLIITSTTFTQNITTVTGNVKNNKTKESIPAVSVTIKGASGGAFTDEKGNFKFTTTQKPPFTLVISSIGFETKEIEYSGQSVDVELATTY